RRVVCVRVVVVAALVAVGPGGVDVAVRTDMVALGDAESLAAVAAGRALWIAVAVAGERRRGETNRERQRSDDSRTLLHNFHHTFIVETRTSVSSAQRMRRVEIPWRRSLTIDFPCRVAAGRKRPGAIARGREAKPRRGRGAGRGSGAGGRS